MKREDGFTFIELMAVLFIVAIVSGVAVINVINYGQRYQIDTARERLLQELRITRSEAVSRNTSASLIKDPKSLTFSMVWTNADGDHTIHNGIRICDGEFPLNWSGKGWQSIGRVDFDRMGKVSNLVGFGTIDVQNPKNTYSRSVELNEFGYVSRVEN